MRAGCALLSARSTAPLASRFESSPHGHTDAQAHRYPDGDVVHRQPQPCADGNAHANPFADHAALPLVTLSLVRLFRDVNSLHFQEMVLIGPLTEND